MQWHPLERQVRPGWPGMAQLSGTEWEFALNTERQLNVKTATVHEKANKANSPLLHFELIDRGNNLPYHSPVSLLKSWPWNRWSDEGEAGKLTVRGNKQTNKKKRQVKLQKPCLTARQYYSQARRKQSVHKHTQSRVQTYKNLECIIITRLFTHEQRWAERVLFISDRCAKCSLKSASGVSQESREPGVGGSQGE